jgi:NAD(P)-dependent dehydrogenase (short-subunit alcohol dehydrogenase family)
MSAASELDAAVANGRAGRRDAHGRRALVTGASSGIGSATARRLGEAGWRVALIARRGERLDELAREIEARGGEALPLRCDLRDPAAIERACAEVERSFGGLELLVNNAGIGYRARVEELDPAIVRDVLDTNVTAVLLLCRAALPLLRRGERPVVVNVASVVARRGIPGQAVYAASKAAVVSIGEALRIEWARDRIAVCTLNPALTSTGFFGAQANPGLLADPDLAGSDSPDLVARHVLALALDPRPERSLRGKWRLLALLSLLAPRFADRILVRRLGGDWSAPSR